MNPFLFDMDGTLTEPRRPAKKEIAEALFNLSELGDIGILTGSHLKYVIEQLSILINNIDKFKNKLFILPCNGTQFYEVLKDKQISNISSNNMIEEIGHDTYIHLLHSICDLQSEFSENYLEIPHGQFVQYRGSLLNWCPIGRSSNSYFRNDFIEKDVQNQIRKKLIKKLGNKLYKNNMQDHLELVLGGSTSIDIYPIGWGKEYALRYFGGSGVYFWGDKCFGDGNDVTIYNKLYPMDCAFSVDSVQETIDSIKSFVKKM